MTQQKIGSTWILQELVAGMRRAIEGRGPRMSLFSSHEETLVVLLGALRLLAVDCVLDAFEANTTTPDCISEDIDFAASLTV